MKDFYFFRVLMKQYYVIDSLFPTQIRFPYLLSSIGSKTRVYLSVANSISQTQSTILLHFYLVMNLINFKPVQNLRYVNTDLLLKHMNVTCSLKLYKQQR